MGSETEPLGIAQTVVKLDDGDRVLTRADAEGMRTALVDHLATSRKVAVELGLTPESHAWVSTKHPAWIDDRGQLRVGLWLLEARGGALVLTHRKVPVTRPVSLVYVAHLEKAEGLWKVSSISVERIYPSDAVDDLGQ